MPAVSVIIPVFKVELYIERCARSLFQQTLGDIEYIFVDDCSPDRSIAIVRDVLEDYPERKNQVRFYHMSKNSGLAAVRYYGYTVATGDYVIACDSDDDVDTSAYQRMYDVATTNDLDIVLCDYWAVKDGIQTAKSMYSQPGTEVDSLLVGKTMGSLWCRMFRRSLLNGVEAAVGAMSEDLVISVQAHIKATRIGYISEPLYYYFLRNSSITWTPGLVADLSRWKSSYSNAKLLVDLLVNRYGLDGNRPSIVFYKYRNRAALKKYVHMPEYYQKWRQTFPEIDCRFLVTGGIPLIEKFWFILIHLRLYHPWKMMTQFLRRCFCHTDAR
jgi:glycosyltransferase involved in cell wall biosynthesis